MMETAGSIKCLPDYYYYYYYYNHHHRHHHHHTTTIIIIIIIIIIIKIKFTLEQATKAQRWRRCIAKLLL